MPLEQRLKAQIDEEQSKRIAENEAKTKKLFVTTLAANAAFAVVLVALDIVIIKEIKK